MAGSGFGTEFEAMNQAANKLQDVKDQLNGELGSLVSQLEPLSGSWKGAASAAFQQLIDEFRNDAQKIFMALEQIRESMSKASATYQATEEQAQSSIRGVLG